MSQPTDRLSTLDDAALRRWLFRARDALGRHRERLDALNVYPVPDGDTGTNLHLTLESGLQGFVDALMSRAQDPEAEPLGVVEGAAVLARSTLLAARGNSGVILSQLVAGLAGALAAHPDADESGVDGPLLAAVLAEADRCARQAVAEPVEGTILTVIRAAADAAASRIAAGEVELADVTRAAHDAAAHALADTPTQLAALARAGVVDAGGAGLLLVLEALDGVAHGEPRSEDLPAEMDVDQPSAAGVRPSTLPVVPQYEVMFLLDRVGDADAARLRGALTRLGDSVLVGGDERLRTVHVHTADAGAAIEVGLETGRPYGIRITLLPDDGSALHVHAAEPAPPEDTDGPEVGVVACLQAPGLRELFEEAGAVVVADGPGRRVALSHLVAAARQTRAHTVVVLPDDPDARLVADAAVGVAAQEGLDLVVIGTDHIAQGLAALAVLDPDDPESIERMRTAASAVRCGVVATATTAAHTDAGPCRPGDVLGFAEDRVVCIGTDTAAVADEVIGMLLTDEAELVTLIEGEHARGVGERIAEPVGVEVSILTGEQSVYDLFIGVE
ncbi:MAG: DAK2 domain-containing protein [Mobilicoccus sp.]|nr:DAK2 domain-containing protein [Mobilicoccus sp.]